MKKSVAMKWVKALRSGKYKQGTGELKSEEGKYCCLGVLCDISGKTGWRFCATLPEHVRKWSGIKDNSGAWKSKYGYNRLTMMNDVGQVCGPDGRSITPLGRPFTFNEIADWIEKHYEVL